MSEEQKAKKIDEQVETLLKEFCETKQLDYETSSCFLYYCLMELYVTKNNLSDYAQRGLYSTLYFGYGVTESLIYCLERLGFDIKLCVWLTKEVVIYLMDDNELKSKIEIHNKKMVGEWDDVQVDENALLLESEK